jgi:hypothetical protein
MLANILHLLFWPVFIVICWYVIRLALMAFEKNLKNNIKE